MKKTLRIAVGLALVGLGLPSCSDINQPTEEGPNLGLAKGKEKVTICHKNETITVAAPALPAHLAHGDTQGACLSCVAPPSDLVSWWPLDGNANDIIGGNNGTLVGVTFAAGKVGQAASFTRVSETMGDYLFGPDAGFPSGASPRTVDLWARITQLHFGSGGSFFCYGSAAVTRNFCVFEVPVGTNTFIAFVSRFDDIIPATGPILNDGEWHHVAMVYDGANMLAYVDGDLVWNVEKLINTALGGFRIGNSRWGTNHLGGLIDEVQIFERALTAEEIKSIFNAGSAGKCKP